MMKKLSTFSRQPPVKIKIMGVLLAFVLFLGLFAPAQATPVKAACTWGDIICDMQQALQQLVDNYVTPLKVWVQLQANKAVYSRDSVSSALLA